MATLSLAWTIANPNVTTAIIGATKKEQLLENLKAIEAKEKLTSEILQKIDEIVGTKPVLAEY